MVDDIIHAIEQAPDAPVVLGIESDGGDPIAAFRLYDALRRHPPPVTTRTAAHCHSAAVIVFMAGDARLASRGARFLLHGVERQPRERPTAAALWAEAASLDGLDRQIADLICIRAGRYPLWRLRLDMRNETMLGADDAYRRGIITWITDC